VWQETAKYNEDIQPHKDYKHEVMMGERMDHKQNSIDYKKVSQVRSWFI